MSWDTTMPTLLRSVIGDTGATPQYADTDLIPVIIAAAQFVTLRVSFSQPYAIDLENNLIAPDPTTDAAFVNLTTLKAACMLMNAEVRVYGKQAISIRDGTSSIDLKRDLRALKEIAESFCRELDKAISQYMYSTNIPGEAIIGPHRGRLSYIFPCPYRICR